MPEVLDRTRAVRCGKGRQPCRYEVVVYHTEQSWDDDTGSTVAKFAYPGDAFLYAKAFREQVFKIVVRN